MENGMLIGNNGKKSLPDTLPNLYHGKKDAYVNGIQVDFSTQWGNL
jgi:hypothetical protein